VALPPAKLITVDPKWESEKKKIASAYNRIGGLIQVLAVKTDITAAGALAVWYVESGGKEHTPQKAIIRFENHHFYRYWGKANETEYCKYFQHGGHNGVSGASDKNHKYREKEIDEFENFHGNQDKEYAVLKFAKGLSTEETALKCISIGGCQILVSNHAIIGYKAVKSMYDKFQAEERCHVLGFFDFCKYNKLLKPLKNCQWETFAAGYNGNKNKGIYGNLIKKAFAAAQSVI
jgi:hypothetical protein